MSAFRTSSSAALRAGPGEIEVIVFDVGGVLVELGGVNSILEWSLGRFSIEDVWRLWLASPAVRAFETGRTDADAFALAVLSELELDLEPSRFLEAFRR